LLSAEELNRRYFRTAYGTGVHGWQSTEASPYIVERLRVVAQAAPGGRLLDLGCGEGRHCILAAEMGFTVTGVDYEPLAIGRALGNVRRAGREDKVRFAVADIFALPFRAGSFDVLLDFGCLHHQKKSDWVRYLAMVRTVLRPGGWFLLTTFSTHFGAFGPQKRRWHLARGAYRRFFTADDIRRLLEEDLDLVSMNEEREGPRGLWHVLMRRKA